MATVNNPFTNKWTEEQLKILKEYYSIKGAKYVSELVNRSTKSVLAKLPD